MTIDPGIVERISMEFASALSPLANSLESKESLHAFIEQIGWNLPENTASIGIDANLVSDVFSALETVINMEFEITDQAASASNYLKLTVSVAALVAHINELHTKLGDFVDATFLSASNMTNELAKRIVDYLVIEHIRTSYGWLFQILVIVGIVELREFAEDTTNFTSEHTRRIIHYDRVNHLFTDPARLLKETYGWGTTEGELGIFIDRLFYLLLLLKIPARLEFPALDRRASLWAPIPLPLDEEVHRPELRIPFIYERLSGTNIEVGLALYPVPASGPNTGPGLAISPYSSGTSQTEFSIGDSDEWSLKLAGDLDIKGGIAIIARPHEKLKVLADISNANPVETKGSCTLELRRQTESDESITLIDAADIFRLDAKALFLRLRLTMDETDAAELSFELGFEEGKIQVSTSDADSFISKILPSDGLQIDLDLTMGWSSSQGVYIAEGSGNSTTGFEKIVPINKTAGPLTLQSTYTSLSPNSEGITIIFGLGASLKIGPLVITVDKIGVLADIKTLSQAKGLFGYLDLKLRFKSPDGLGLSINANGVKGFGFIAKTENRYSGVINLDLFGYSVQALVIVKTDPFPSVLFAIFAQFKKAIQLGAGWKITKIGGMLGINHTVSHSKIATGIKSGILDNLMFPDNIVRDAPTVIANYEDVFPVQQGQNIFGPAIQIAYGTPTIITGDVAVILEFPYPALLSILGKVTCKVPNKDKPIIQINVGIVGALDIVNGKVGVYGSIYDSKILNFVLTGDMAMAASWGSEKNFIFSIGGFNPRFTPPTNFPPFGAPPLKRLNLAFSSYVTFECYLALTSNTLQIGARVEAKFEKSGAKISGFLEFDAIVQFNPLYYVIDVAGGFSVRFKGRSLASITFSGFIEGPNPHRINGSLTFSIWWWDISIHIDKTFGDQKPEVVSKVNPWDILKEALQQNDSWTVDPPSWAVAGVVTKESSGALDTDRLIHPMGTPKVSQNMVPINHTLTKFGFSDPENWFRFEIISLNNNPASELRATKDYFAPGQFTEFDTEEMLSLNSYDLLDSGVSDASSGEQVSCHIASVSLKEMEYETRILSNFNNKDDIISKKEETHKFSVNVSQVQTFLLASTAYSASVINNNRKKYQLDYQPTLTSIRNEKFVIADEDNNLEKILLGEEMSQASALNLLQQRKRINPADKRNLKVISDYEVKEALV